MATINVSNGLVAAWVGKNVSGHNGTFYDLKSGATANIVRNSPATIFDANTGQIHLCATGYLPTAPWSSYRVGATGYACVTEEARTNLFLGAYIPDVTASARWSASGDSVTLNATAHGFYLTSKGMHLSSSATRTGIFQSLAYAATGYYTISGHAWRPNGSAVSATSLKVCYAATSLGCAASAKTATYTLMSNMVGPSGQPVYRVSATAAITGKQTNNPNGARSVGFFAPLGASVRIDCAQIEVTTGVAPYASSFIPTAAAAVQRVATIASIWVNKAGYEWSAPNGTVVVVSGGPGTLSTTSKQFGFEWEASSTNTIYLYVGSSLTRAYARGAAATASSGDVTDDGGAGVRAMTWAAGAQVKGYHDSTASTTVNANYTEATGLPTSAKIGRAYGGPIHAVLAYNRALSAAEITTLQSIIDGATDIKAGSGFPFALLAGVE